MAETMDHGLSVERRTPDLEDYLDIVRRHKGWIFGPIFASLVVAVVVAFFWPDTYVSTAVVRVVPPQVPEAFVPVNVNMEMSQRINSMAQQILSRSVLTNIINTYGLYPRERARLPMEDVVEAMRQKDVRISNVVNFNAGGSDQRRQVPAFQIAFTYENRNLAKKVCEDLVSRFITENQRDRQNQSMFTTQFLKDQLEMAKRELVTVEDKLAQFRIQNAGKLPDQVAQNLQQLNALEQRASNLNGVVSRLNQERLLMESEARIAADRLQSVGSATEQIPYATVQAKNDRLAQMDRDVQQVELQVSALSEQYTDAHPDLKRARAALVLLKANREKVAQQEETNTKKSEAPQTRTVVNPQVAREQKDLESTVRRLRSAMEAKDLELEETKRDLARAEAQIKLAQSRIDVTPLGEKEYMDLLRERSIVMERVNDFNKRQSISKVATDLENRQQGETLELLDPASLPVKPAEPNRLMIVGAGVGIGFVLGVFFAAGRELKDTSLKNLKDVRAYTQLNILGSIPLLENDLVVKRRRRLGWLAWSTALLIGTAVMSASMYYYYFVAHVS